jgi:hypothetical protein
MHAASAGDTVEDALQLTKQWLGSDADYASISVGGEQDEAAPVTGQQSNFDHNWSFDYPNLRKSACLLAYGLQAHHLPHDMHTRREAAVLGCMARSARIRI